jgi:predicted aspartyl protease
MREEVSLGFTVPASINGNSCSLLVDTGGANTLLNEQMARQFGLSFRGSRLTMSFADGVARKVRLGKVSNLMIGDFPVPPQNLAAAALPDFAVEHGGNVHVAGIIGMEFMALNRGIIDFDSMNLFLK